jgi:hypothetical protein
VPLYVSDCSRLFARSSLRPRRSARDVLEWIRAHERELRSVM